MFNTKLKQTLRDTQALLAEKQSVLHGIQDNIPCIEFTPDGKIVTANNLFLGAVGYSLNEIQGQHHKIFCPEHIVRAREYSNFWANLSKGQAQTGRFERMKKDGTALYIEAFYLPIKNESSKVVKVIKIASDVTDKQVQAQKNRHILQAIDTTQASIEFKTDGTILTANKNFLGIFGYSLNEIQGQHHRIFCFDDFYKKNPTFWEQLARGEPFQGTFKRKNKRGEEIFIEATYTPIFDDNNKVIKVIKFATDVTQKTTKAQQTLETIQSTCVISQQTCTVVDNGMTYLDVTVEMFKGIASSVTEANTLMGNLANASQEIFGLTKTISDISSQTNLLALNAAIEAARAGDAGRGFSVVADEVRALSAKTATATIQITQTIQSIVGLISHIEQMMNEVERNTCVGTEKIDELSSIMQEVHEGAENILSKLQQ